MEAEVSLRTALQSPKSHNVFSFKIQMMAYLDSVKKLLLVDFDCSNLIGNSFWTWTRSEPSCLAVGQEGG